MLPHNISSKQSNKDEDQSMGGGSGGDGGGSGGRSTSSMKPPEQILKCPRCDSPNTKFCYYNNYNMAQPRHFCKACKRYWTKGGALRNVPIGGSCRKNKKTKPYSKYSSSDVGGMKMFGLSTLDFQLGGLNFPPRVTAANQLCSSYLVNLDPLGYNDNNNYNNNIVMGTSNNHVHHNSNLASSIESLSSINQDLHWKLQQQRFSLLFGGGDGGGSNGGSGEKLQPILFQNLETSKPAQSSMDGDSSGCGLATECFFDKNYVAANRNPTISANSDGAGNDQNGSMDEWNGIQSWNQYRDGLSYED